MRQHLERFLAEHGVSQQDTDIVIAHFANTPFTVRKVLFTVMRAHADSIAAFVDILRKKHEFNKQPSRALADDILMQERALIAERVSALEPV